MNLIIFQKNAQYKFVFCLLILLLDLLIFPVFPILEIPPLLSQEVLQMSDFTKISAEFVQQLIAGNFTAAVEKFDETMQIELPAEKLQETWRSLLEQVGQFQRTVRDRVEVSEDYTTVLITCEFERATLDLKIVFNSSGAIAGLFFVPTQSTAEYEPPEYVNLETFEEQTVAIGTGEDRLPGTLTLPKGNGPFPAVILVQGSGPNDRDESIGPNKPFRDLAWGLASQGIAVLRYDKRTLVYPEQFAGNFTVAEEVTNDAITAVSLLEEMPAIAPEKIFILGHSLGGMLIPRMGMLRENLAGLIILAGPTRPFEDLFLAQINYIAQLDGFIDVNEQVQIDAIAAQVARIQSPELSTLNSPEPLLGAPASYWLDLRGYHPPTVAQQLPQPLLILQGERDYQVTMEDFAAWQEALVFSPNITLKAYSQLNHLFIPGSGQITPAEYQQPGHVSREVIRDIANWIKNQSADA